MIELLKRGIWGRPVDNGRIATESVPSEIAAELKGQADRLSSRFAEELEISSQEYRDKLPPFVNIRETLRGTGFRPFYVETRIPLLRMAEILGIEVTPEDRIKMRDIKDWGKFKTPRNPYIAWLADPRRDYTNVRVSAIRWNENHNTMSRGGTIREGFSYFIRHPEVLEPAVRLLSFPGSRGKSREKVPVMGRWGTVIDPNSLNSNASTRVLLYEVPADGNPGLNLVAAKV